MGKKKVGIVVDAMGGDNAPAQIVKGAAAAAAASEDVQLFLTGKESVIEKELGKYQYPKDRIKIVNAEEEISCDESPVEAIRKKKDSSMVVGMKMVKDGTADAFISAGSSGAVLVGGQFIVGRIKGVKRAPLAALMPTKKGVCLIVDSGANMDCRGEYLLEFANMGSVYMEQVVGIKNPKVALVNVGVEEAKGNTLVKDAYPLLKESGLHFTGSIEPRDIHSGDADVVVCDGFVGNVILKLSEGLAGTLVSIIKQGLLNSLRSKIGALLVKPALKKTLTQFDASEHGGAPLLGLNGLVVKIHGSSGAKETYNAIFQCVNFVRKGTNELIRSKLAKKEEAAHEC